MLVAAAAMAQAPAADRPGAGGVQQGQLAAAAAWRELQDARYEAKLAEQELVNGEDAWKAAQEQARLWKDQVDAARQALQAAREREAQARRRYDTAVKAVDDAYRRK